MTPLICPAEEPAKPRLDAHGFPLPDGAVARLGDSCFLAGGGLAGMSPDGKLILTGGAKFRVWDADAGKLVRETAGPGMTARAWSGDGRLALCMTRDVEMQVWNVEAGKPHWKQPATPFRDEYGSCVTAVRFIDNDRQVVIVSAPRGPRLWHREFAAGDQEKDIGSHPGWRVDLWDVANGERSSRWKVDADRKARLKELGDGYDYCYVALSPTGERMAWLASRPREAEPGKSTAFIHETKSGKLLHTVKELPQTYRVDLPDEGETLVVHPVRPADVKKLTTLKGVVVGVPEGRVRFEYDYRFIPDVHVSIWDSTLVGNVMIERSSVRVRDSLITFDGVGMARWDWTTGKLLDEFRLYFDYFATRFAAASDGKRFVVQDGARLRVSDGELTPRQQDANFASSPGVRFLADGRLETCDGDEDGFHGVRRSVWNPRTGKMLEREWVSPPPDELLHWGEHDSSRRRLTYQSRRGGFVLFDLVANERLLHVKEKGESLSLSGDGKRVLLSSRGEDRLVVKWFDGRTGEELGRHEVANRDRQAEPREWEARWFAADGSVFRYITADNRLALVNTDGEKRAPTIIPPRGPSPWEVYHGAGFDRLVLGRRKAEGRDVEYALWDRRGNLLRLFRVARDEKGPFTVRLSPDGRTLATYMPYVHWIFNQRDVALYETATGRLRGRIKPEGPATLIQSVDFSPDSRLLATSSGATVLVWDAARPLGDKPVLASPKNAADAEKLWESLGDGDPQESDRALWALVAAPGAALEVLRDRMKPTREQRAGLRDLRGLEVLERIGTPEAKKVVEAVAAGPADAVLTNEAQLILARWQGSPEGR